jgi:putative aldouronate transport system permease protein
MKRKTEAMDVLLWILLTGWGLLIILPFFNALAISFASYKEYLTTPLMIFPKFPELRAYKEILTNPRIITGYRTSITIILIGIPISIFLTSSMGYALSRRNYPGRKFFFLFILFTMLFNGGMVPFYLVVRSLKLTNTIWAMILPSSINTFYMILMYNYFQSLPESLVESARLEGAGEWTILFKIIIPLSMPIIATITLFFTVDKWNEWFNAMIFIRRSDIQPLQMVLRAMIVEARPADEVRTLASVMERSFPMGIKMAAVLVTMLPIMCIYPFLQKHFAKGIMLGAIKT